MNDPQWLAHPLMTTGLVVLLRGGDTALAGAAALMLAAGLVKHILIPLPLAVTVWLALTNRRGLRLWLGVSLTLLLVALLGLYAAYGWNVFAGLLEGHRELRLAAVAAKTDRWLVPLLPAIGASLMLLFLDGRDRQVRLLVLYALFAGLWRLFVWSGVGVSENAAFDLVIATSIGAALAVDRLGVVRSRVRTIQPPARTAAALVLASTVLLSAPYHLGQGVKSLQQTAERRASVAADIAFLRAQEGPAVCEDLALCYWAGKGFGMDVFSTGQKLATGILTEPEFDRVLAAGGFTVLQLAGDADGPRTFRLPASVTDRLAADYAVRRVSPTGGVFLVPAWVDAAATR